MINCQAYLGATLGLPIKLDRYCLESVGQLAHELGHIIGLHHEHQRNDRDHYIEILWSNIRGPHKYGKVHTYYTYASTRYDLGSIMHYSPYNSDAVNKSLPVFQLRGNVTYAGKIGQRDCLSLRDVEAINTLYNCSPTSKCYVRVLIEL